MSLVEDIFELHREYKVAKARAKVQRNAALARRLRKASGEELADALRSYGPKCFAYQLIVGEAMERITGERE